VDVPGAGRRGEVTQRLSFREYRRDLMVDRKLDLELEALPRATAPVTSDWLQLATQA
jgi:hypothetical protein